MKIHFVTKPILVAAVFQSCAAQSSWRSGVATRSTKIACFGVDPNRRFRSPNGWRFRRYSVRRETHEAVLKLSFQFDQGQLRPSRAIDPLAIPSICRFNRAYRMSEHEYAFDVKLAAVVRVIAESENIARGAIERALDAVSLDIGVSELDGQVKITEASASIDDCNGLYLFEIDGRNLEFDEE